MRPFVLICLSLLGLWRLAYGQCFLSDQQSLCRKTYTAFFADEELNEAFQLAKEDIEEVFGVKADLYFCEEEEGPNAYALPHGSYLKDGEVYFGLKLIEKQLWRRGEDAGYALIAVLAHELAHVL